MVDDLTSMAEFGTGGSAATASEEGMGAVQAAMGAAGMDTAVCMGSAAAPEVESAA